MNKHTPGPWFIRDGYKDLIEDSDGIRVAAVLSDNENYDAHLIAAAPEMLDFINEFIGAWESGFAGDSYLLHMACDVFAKAKGEI